MLPFFGNNKGNVHIIMLYFGITTSVWVILDWYSETRGCSGLFKITTDEHTFGEGNALNQVQSSSKDSLTKGGLTTETVGFRCDLLVRKCCIRQCKALLTVAFFQATMIKQQGASNSKNSIIDISVTPITFT